MAAGFIYMHLRVYGPRINILIGFLKQYKMGFPTPHHDTLRFSSPLIGITVPYPKNSADTRYTCTFERLSGCILCCRNASQFLEAFQEQSMNYRDWAKSWMAPFLKRLQGSSQDTPFYSERGATYIYCLTALNMWR